MLAECAVINAGPLVALSLAGRLDLLPALFREFWIPETVFHEVAVAGLGRPGSQALSAARWAPHVRPVPEPDPLLIAELDPGDERARRAVERRREAQRHTDEEIALATQALATSADGGRIAALEELVGTEPAPAWLG